MIHQLTNRPHSPLIWQACGRGYFHWLILLNSSVNIIKYLVFNRNFHSTLHPQLKSVKSRPNQQQRWQTEYNPRIKDLRSGPRHFVLYLLFDSQRWYLILVFTVPVDNLTQSGARSSAGVLMRKFRSLISTALEGWTVLGGYVWSNHFPTSYRAATVYI